MERGSQTEIRECGCQEIQKGLQKVEPVQCLNPRTILYVYINMSGPGRHPPPDFAIKIKITHQDFLAAKIKICYALTRMRHVAKKAMATHITVHWDLGTELK